MLNKSSLHYQVMKSIVDEGSAPLIKDLSSRFDTSSEKIKDCLCELQDDHGVVLHPHSKEVWVMHPFATSPTNYLMRSGDRLWWSNCAWCSLGAAYLIPSDVVVSSTFGAESEPFEYKVSGEEIECGDWYIHFPIPMKNAWDNVTFTCSMMQTFKSKEDIVDWCKRHNVEQGDIQPMKKMFEFAKDWYGKHLDEDWKKWTIADAKRIFQKHGLDGRIWSLDDNKGKF